MIIRTLILFAAVAMMGACQKNIETDDPVTPAEGAKGYLSISLSNNSQNVTKAPVTDDGTPEESKIGSESTVILDNDAKSGAYVNV